MIAELIREHFKEMLDQKDNDDYIIQNPNNAVLVKKVYKIIT